MLDSPLSYHVSAVPDQKVHGTAAPVHWSGTEVKVHDGPGVHGHLALHAVPGADGVAKF